MTDDEIQNLPLKQISDEGQEDEIIPITFIEEQKLAAPYSTGLKKLDDFFLGGFRAGQLIILSGLSKHGKTQLSLQITRSLSHNGIPTLWFSYEMTLSELKWRMEQMGILDELLCFVPKKNISDNIEWLKQKIEIGITKYLIKCVFIDNLDFLTIDQKALDDKLSIQKRIVGTLKQIAIQNNVCIVLNAHVTKLEEGYEPRMQDVYGASETYKLADVVIFIHRLRAEVGRGEQALEYSNQSKIIIDANRLTGKCGSFNVLFNNNVYEEF